MRFSLEFFGKVLRKQLVEMHVTILRARGKAEPIGGKCKGVHCTEMASDLTKSLVINDAL